MRVVFRERLVDNTNDWLAGLQIVDADEDGHNLEAVRSHLFVAHPRLVVDALDVTVGRV